MYGIALKEFLVFPRALYSSQGPAPGVKLTKDTCGLSHQCSATEPQQPDNHQPFTILYMYCTGGTECLSRTPGSHSVCAVRTPLGVDRKNSLHQERTHAEWFTRSKCSEHLPARQDETAYFWSQLHLCFYCEL